MKKVYFYMNNPCVITREVTSDIVEIQLSHKFAEGLELKGKCEGCCIGDSDNKIPCTCEEFEWILEEVQEEENKVIVMVERRLLADNPVEKIQLDKVKARITSQIESEKEKLNKIKPLHLEWEKSLQGKKLQSDALSAEIEAAKLKIESLWKVAELEEGSIEKIRSEYESKLVYISGSNEEIHKHELDALKKKAEKLAALEAGGVDNWEWYDESMKKAGL
jgi:hypothetical protein